MDNELRKLKEIVQSCNINIMIGAGASTPYLPLLGDIEKKIEDANGDEAKVLEQLREYFEKVMLPCLSILNAGEKLGKDDKSKFEATYKGYQTLFSLMNQILINRKSTLLNKQINVFTTNIDIFTEMVLEDLNIDYNDGFSGNVRPLFQTSNFRKSFHKVSSHFGNVSEIPSFNVIKLHGSLSWKIDSTNKKLEYTKLGLLPELEKLSSDDIKFRSKYDELQIVNPSKDKFRQTVMGVTHYDLLRTYSGELEKENSVLFVIGFSMADEHIREITLRVANSNPTLKIYIFCYSTGETQDNYSSWFGQMKYRNVEILSPEGEARYDIATISELFLNSIINNGDTATSEVVEASEKIEG